MFKKQAEEALEVLAESVDAFVISCSSDNIGNKIFCESNFDGDVLEFSIQIDSEDAANTNGKQTYNFVINGHEASQKIWYSSPVSRPKYYAFNAQNKQWIESTNGTNIINDLAADLQNIASIAAQ